MTVDESDSEEEGSEDGNDDVKSVKSKSSMHSKNTKAVLGFKGVDIDKLKRNADFARRWLNFHVL